MDAKKFVLAVLGGAVTLFILGFVFYGWLLMDFFAKAAGEAASVYRAQPILWAIFLGEASFAVLMTLIFGSWGSINTFMGGLKAGALIGLLASLSMGLVFFATTTMVTLSSAVVDLVVSIIRMGLAGAVIAWILGRG